MTTRRAACRALAALALLLVAAPVDAADPAIRVGILQFGTVNWELDVIEAHRLAARHRVGVKVVPLSGKSSTHVSLQGEAVDVIVTDWLWVSRQRAEGRPYTFVPHSLTVGGLIVRPDAGIQTLADLRGRRLGVAGGPVDKSWLLLRAYARRTVGRDMKDLVEPNFAAPPLLNQLMLKGDLPAVLNFWHYGARLKASGMRELVGITDMLAGLGVQGPVPLLGWVFDERWANRHRAALVGFLEASLEAKRILAESDSEWERLRPLVKAEDDATLRALRDAYRAGIPTRFGREEVKVAEQVFAILAQVGGEELVGARPSLSPGTFWDGFEIRP